MLQNMFGDIALDQTVKALKNVLSKIGFTQNGGMRVEPIGGTIATVTTVSTVSSVTTVSSVSEVAVSKCTIGDTTKYSTVQQHSASAFYGTVGRNFDRTNSFGER